MSNKKGKTTKKKTGNQKKPTTTQRKTIQAQQTRRQMWAVVLFAVGLLFLALTFIKGSKVWLKIHNGLFGLLGWSAYFIAPLILYIAVITAKDKPINSIKTKLWQSGVLILMISGAIEIFTGLPETEGFLNLIKALFQKGVENQGGGVFGLLLAGPLLKLADSPGPEIIIILAIFVFVMLISGSTLLSLFQMLRRPVDGIEHAYNSRVQERQQRIQEDLANQEGTFHFDLPQQEEIAEEIVPPPEPQEPEKAKPMRWSGESQVSRPRFNIDVDMGDDWVSERAEPPDLVEVPEIETQETAFREGLSNTQPLEPIAPFAGADRPENEGGRRESPAIAEGEQTADTLQQPVPFSVVLEDAEDVPEPFAPTIPVFGVDQPTEMVSVIPSEKPEPIEIPKQPWSQRPHPLLEDIRMAKEDDLAQEMDAYLDDIQTGEEEQEPEDWGDLLDYIDDPTALLNAMLARQMENEGADIPLPDTVAQELADHWQVEEEISDDFSPEPERAEGLDEPVAHKAPAQAAVPTADTADSAATAAHEPESEPKPPEPKYEFPPMSLLTASKESGSTQITKEIRERGHQLVALLESFGVNTRMIHISRGPAVTRYELQPQAGVKISRITGLADDIALGLAAAGIRIEAPIPNKPAVGIEVPNDEISLVRIRDIMDTEEFRKPSSNISTALGKDIAGNTMLANIANMPHVLIAGATGSGKSVCINSIIISILYKYTPQQVKLLMIDPKVVELGVYNGIPHLLVPVVTNSKKSAGALAWAVSEMEERYQTFAELSVRDLAGYNRLAEKSDELPTMPQIVIIIDELADLMMVAPTEVEEYIFRLAQKARASGMYLVIATQRPSVDVITGVIKANIPSRIAFAVSSQVDSRTILDTGGAEKLLGRGDMLFAPVGASKPTRVQGCFVTDQEVEKVVQYIKETEQAEYDEGIVEEIEKFTTTESAMELGDGGGLDEEDELTGEAIEIVMDAGQASISQLQRRLRVGYARAGRLIDTLEHMGIVGPHEGSKPRQVLMTQDEYLEMQLMNEEALSRPEER